MIVSSRDGHDVRPAAHVAPAITIIAHGDHCAVPLQTDRIIPSSRDGHNVRPAAHVALAILIVAHGDHRAVPLQADGMIGSSRDGHDVRPAVHVALAKSIVAHGDHRAVPLQADGMIVSSRDGHDVRPAAHVALAILIVAPGDHRAVPLQADRMIASSRHTAIIRFCIVLLVGLEQLHLVDAGLCLAVRIPVPGNLRIQCLCAFPCHSLILRFRRPVGQLLLNRRSLVIRVLVPGCLLVEGQRVLQLTGLVLRFRRPVVQLLLNRRGFVGGIGIIPGLAVGLHGPFHAAIQFVVLPQLVQPLGRAAGLRHPREHGFRLVVLLRGVVVFANGEDLRLRVAVRPGLPEPVQRTGVVGGGQLRHTRLIGHCLLPVRFAGQAVLGEGLRIVALRLAVLPGGQGDLPAARVSLGRAVEVGARGFIPGKGVLVVALRCRSLTQLIAAVVHEGIAVPVPGESRRCEGLQRGGILARLMQGPCKEIIALLRLGPADLIVQRSEALRGIGVFARKHGGVGCGVAGGVGPLRRVGEIAHGGKDFRGPVILAPAVELPAQGVGVHGQLHGGVPVRTHLAEGRHGGFVVLRGGGAHAGLVDGLRSVGMIRVAVQDGQRIGVQPMLPRRCRQLEVLLPAVLVGHDALVLLRGQQVFALRRQLRGIPVGGFAGLVRVAQQRVGLGGLGVAFPGKQCVGVVHQALPGPGLGIGITAQGQELRIRAAIVPGDAGGLRGVVGGGIISRMGLVCLLKGGVDVVGPGKVAAVVQLIGPGLHGKSLAVPVTAQGVVQGDGLVVAAGSGQRAGLAVAALADLCRAVSILAQRGEGSGGLVEGAILQQGGGGIVHGGVVAAVGPVAFG